MSAPNDASGRQETRLPRHRGSPEAVQAHGAPRGLFLGPRLFATASGAIEDRWRKFRASSPSDRRMLFEAAACLAAARLLILAAPAPRLAAAVSRAPKGGTAPADPALAAAVGRAVSRAARNLPWDAACLPQAMAARFMLARRGRASTLHLGAAMADGGGLTAHAWLSSGETIVVGGAGVRAVTSIARF